MGGHQFRPPEPYEQDKDADNSGLIIGAIFMIVMMAEPAIERLKPVAEYIRSLF
jgi:hypothetical protein